MTQQPVCVIRPAENQDTMCLLSWANQPDSLNASLFTRQKIAREAHERWFAERLLDPNTRIWVIEQTGKPVGQIRRQDKGEGLEVAIFVEAAVRGCGIAGDALELALQEAQAVWCDAPILARILKHNSQSKRFFARHGFSLHDDAGDHEVYIRNPSDRSA